MAMEQERRAITDPVDVRADEGGLTLGGYAALYETSAEIAGFTERIERGAFTEAVQRDDVRALFNHDPNYVLGRTHAGTLTLTEDARGLRYDVRLPETTWARDLHESIKRGDISQSSFAFRVDEEEWEKGTKATLPVRRIRKVTLYDVSPVTYPAYAQTTVSARALEHAVTDAVAVTEPETAVPVPRYRALLTWFDKAIDWYGGR